MYNNTFTYLYTFLVWILAQTFSPGSDERTCSGLLEAGSSDLAINGPQRSSSCWSCWEWVVSPTLKMSDAFWPRRIFQSRRLSAMAEKAIRKDLEGFRQVVLARSFFFNLFGEWKLGDTFLFWFTLANCVWFFTSEKCMERMAHFDMEVSMNRQQV